MISGRHIGIWWRSFLAAVSMVLLVHAPAGAQRELDEAAAAARYRTCLALADENPQSAYDQALDWRDHDSGGRPAEHCAAVALTRLGSFTEAARRLEILARDSEEGMAAQLYGQAGQAWYLAGDMKRAYSNQTKAVDRAPGDPDLLIDRAFTLVDANDVWRAIDDLTLAAQLAPGRGDILIYRASAHRLVGSPDLAMTDVERGLTLLPNDANGLLERGILKRMEGDEAGARADWLDAIQADPESEAAEAARGNLARMDIGGQGSGIEESGNVGSGGEDSGVGDSEMEGPPLPQ